MLKVIFFLRKFKMTTTFGIINRAHYFCPTERHLPISKLITMQKTISYTPSGVCSRLMEVTAEDGIIKHVQITGGCSGNTQGVATLLEGVSVVKAISLLEGIDCKGKGTSCPDQLSHALRKLL